MVLEASDRALAAVHDVALVDLDGVVYRGAVAVPHAVESLAAARVQGMTTSFLTNNASREASEVAEHLRDLGIPASDGDVVTAAEAIARIVAEAVPSGSTVLVVGGQGLRGPLERLGLACTRSADDNPAAVVQGFHPDVGWRDLAEAAYAIAAGVPWFASNADATVPTERGTAPGNGSLIAAIARATGGWPVVAGKPERGLFDEAVRRTGARRPLVVGDRLDTDIAGARHLGLTALSVLTGIDSLAEIVAAPPDARPHYVAPDLGALVEPHPRVEVSAGRATCADAVACVANDEIDLVAGEPGSTTAVRAVVELGWNLADITGRPPRLTARALGH